MSSKVAIIGGGFAGVKCARTLRKRLGDQVQVTIFNRENHMVFHPMLAEVAGGSLQPEAVAAPLRQMLPKVRCRTEEVRDVDLDAKEISFVAHDGRIEKDNYDHVVFACGSIVSLGMVPGMADHAFALKTIGDAMAIRAHVMQQLEKAECCDDDAMRKWYTSFVVVGGGYSGVEAAGEINELARSSRKYYSRIAADDIKVTLIHSRAQLLPEISEGLREFTREKMQKSGIDVLLEKRVALATPRGVGLKDGTMVEGATVICTIGTQPSPVILRLNAEQERGRLQTETDMRLVGRKSAWAIGDCALVTNAHDGKPSPPTGQFAERQGRQAAENIASSIKGEATRAFSFKPMGQLCAIGGHSAVAEIMGMRISGFFAWVLWRFIYLMKLPSLSRKIKVSFDWLWELVFSRDLSHLKADTSERVSHAYYREGDVIFYEGDPAADFYVIESGEVAILKPGQGEDIIAILKDGDFFGEMALMSDKPRGATVRAHTDVEVVIMGKQVFGQLSDALAPLKEIIVKEAQARSSAGK